MKMFEYNGNIPQVKEAIEDHRDRLTNVYREIFGDRYNTLEMMCATLLQPSMQLTTSDEKEVNSAGFGATPLPDNSCFSVDCTLEYKLTVYPSGKVGKNKAIMRPLIIISEDTIEVASQSEKYKGLPKYLIPYIHEFNHFANFCFQEVPDALAGFIGWLKAEEFGEVNNQDPLKDLKPEQEKWIRIFSHEFCVSEVTQDFLTAQVFERLGYDGKIILAFDPDAKKLLDEYRIRDTRSLFDFNTYWNTRISYYDKFQETFFKTLGNIKVVKEPFIKKS